MIKLTHWHIESLAAYLLESFDEGIDPKALNADHIATMIRMYVESDKACDDHWMAEH